MKSYSHLYERVISKENRLEAVRLSKHSPRIRKMIKESGKTDEEIAEEALGWIENFRNDHHKPIRMTRPTTTGDFFFDYLKSSGFTDYAAAGIYANLQAESGLKSTNLQNSYEKKLGMNDETYTTAVDSGTYDNFVHDSAGYGLAQWTYWSRKQALLQYARSKGKSIGDKTMQMEFLVREMSKALVTKLNASKSASEAAKIFMLEFEKPGDQSIAAQNKRAQMAEDALKRLL